MSKKEFSRNICFTFFEDYKKTADELEKDFGKELVADYYNAIINYALYNIEPELKGTLKYVWHTTKTTIEKSIERRSNSFSKENTEQTNKILKYKEENPNATQREIADATGISVGKVNKVLKANVSSDSISTSNTNSNTTTIHEREREHDSLSQVANAPQVASLDSANAVSEKWIPKDNTSNDIFQSRIHTDVRVIEILKQEHEDYPYESAEYLSNMPCFYDCNKEAIRKYAEMVLILKVTG